MNCGLKGCIPATVKRVVGSGAISEWLGRRRCPFRAKNCRYFSRISAVVSGPVMRESLARWGRAEIGPGPA